MSAEFLAPAKVNLSLRVIGRRDDGFHEVETLMVPVRGLSDRLRFTAADEFSLECTEPGVPVDESNLVTKAVRVFQAATGRACRFRIELEKSIPHGAGLGGGSSDAAATLRALDSLEATRLGTRRLAELAGDLGSDVPFFVFDQACWCRGRGELVEPATCRISRPIVLLKPSFGVATPDAYSRWRGAAELPGISYAPQHLDGLTLFNDLERPVFAKHVFLAEVKLWLAAQPGVAAALMSGSGSTMFAILDDPATAHDLICRARLELDPTLWAGHFLLSTHPAHS
jgi:4-diphosphocytidyl-2-C-methyl-D-erythritol kinase